MRTGNAFYDNLPKGKKRDFGSLFLDNFDADAQNAEQIIDGFLGVLEEFITEQLKAVPKQIDLRKIYFLIDINFDGILNIYNIKILLDGATFQKQANFIKANFKEASFTSCFFKDKAIFENTIFSNGVDFQHTFFEADTIFRECSFGNEGIANFFDVTFKEDATFVDSKFNSAVFRKTKFLNRAIFNRSHFSNIADFSEMIFVNLANFRFATFEGDTIFTDSIFCNEANFCEIHFGNNAYLNMENISFNEIDLKGTYFESPLLLQLKAYKSDDKIKNYIHDDPTQEQEKKLKDYIKSQQAPLDAQHFANKESARLIKDHFEKQNNITESNKYFRIEQEKYIEELKKKETKEHNKIGTLITLYLNKWVSDFGIDWPRALFSLFIFSYLAAIGYIVIANVYGWLPTSNPNIIHSFNENQSIFTLFMFIAWLNAYLATYQKDNRLNLMVLCGLFAFFALLAFCINWGNDRITTNYIVQLINPVNAFKEKNLYEGIEFYGMIVRVIALVIIYQIIVAFRQNTRRK